MTTAANAGGLRAGEEWTSTEPWIRFGKRIVLWMVGGLFAWSILVSIVGAVVAPGRVTVESSYQTVQNLDGGIIKDILVKNGDRVKKGDVLLRLEGTAATSSHAVALSRVRDLSIQQARLEAERDRRDTFALPPGLDRSDPETARLLAAQTSLFVARRTSRLGEQSVIGERRRQLDGDIAGLGSQLKSARKQLAINEKELAGIRPLFEKGYVNQQRIAPLEREAARLEGEIGRLQSEISKVQGAIMELDLRVAQSEKTFTTEVVDELRKVQAALGEQLESEKTLADRLARIEIRAPRAGLVHALQNKTIGGVVTPASPILQIIPENERLIVSAELKTEDIDKVRPGQPASIRFPSFNSQTTPRIEGEVMRVSAAELTDANGRSYFSADISIQPAELAKLPEGHTLLPGMPAEVYLETGSRSILSYLVKPLLDAMSRTFRES
ncbi:MAG: HlyD family type I secretion periplasmic adaptor subunit [Hyphomicrobiaceae bacterium]|nr:HlyD family type I secretion periplasmic adaptor subunit [Hyphomicrobiaceae bacterium]